MLTKEAAEAQVTKVTDSYVLIVDDDPDARAILGQIVQVVGLSVRSASDGLEALDILRQAQSHTPELVVLDLMMPGLNGFSVYSWLQGNPATRRVPVIVVTACDRDQIDMLKLPGVNQIVRKGEFTVPEMVQLIAQILDVDLQSKHRLTH